jgi:hypothetical protein
MNEEDLLTWSVSCCLMERNVNLLPVDTRENGLMSGGLVMVSGHRIFLP